MALYALLLVLSCALAPACQNCCRGCLLTDSCVVVEVLTDSSLWWSTLKQS